MLPRSLQFEQVKADLFLTFAQRKVAAHPVGQRGDSVRCTAVSPSCDKKRESDRANTKTSTKVFNGGCQIVGSGYLFFHECSRHGRRAF